MGPKFEPVGVLIADSNQTQRQLLLRALRRRPEFHVATCDLDMDSILTANLSAPVEVLLMNLEHPREAWQDLTIVRRLQLVHPEIAKLLLLDSYDRELVVNAFRSGARGLFCLQDYPFRMLCKCIQSIRQGQVWVNNLQLQYLLDAVTQVSSLRTVNTQGQKLLTPREEQVVALVSDGLTNRAVAGELGLSEHTVKKYLFHIFEKLGISTRVELVLYAVNQGAPRPAEWIAGVSA
jgi:DNA-binding NarL/FixJ family response regulator